MTRRGLLGLGVRLGLVAGAWAATSCAPSGFADPTVIQSVRILASSADQPYAAPGAQVTVQVLAYDSRPTQAEPMTIYWIPLVCENPTDDAYYACFQQLESAVNGDGGAGGGGDGGTGGADAGLPFRPGQALVLPTGPSFSYRIPPDAVTSHPAVPGAPVPYGLTVIFNAACAGHLELLPLDPGNINPQQIPVGCFDSSHHQLGAEDWVLGFTRVYAYDTLTNANPVVSYVDVGGGKKKLAVTPQPGAPQVYSAPDCTSATGCLTVPHCTSSNSTDCQIKLGAVVPQASWEVNAQQTDVNGHPLHEEIWSDFYTTIGSLGDEARLLYDPTVGAPPGGVADTDTTFQAPTTAGTGTIWLVVHDNRGGAAWVTVPVMVQ